MEFHNNNPERITKTLANVSGISYYFLIYNNNKNVDHTRRVLGHLNG